MSIVDNKKAFHDYFIEERFEAGLVLEGWEVKAIRAGRANLKEAYVVVKDGAVALVGAHISPLAQALLGNVREQCNRQKDLIDGRHFSRQRQLVAQMQKPRTGLD